MGTALSECVVSEAMRALSPQPPHKPAPTARAPLKFSACLSSKVFAARVLAGEFLAGSWANLGSSLTAEMAGVAGFDWVLLDHEHGPGSDTTILHQLQALAATPAAALVRIAANDPARFKRVLDAGAHGVMIPYVGTAAEAQAAVSAMRYPPRGIRGVAETHSRTAFGAGFDEYFAHAP